MEVKGRWEELRKAEDLNLLLKFICKAWKVDVGTQLRSEVYNLKGCA